MKLIKEARDSVLSCIVEEVSPGVKKYFIEGIFLQGNIQNRNGRVYPMDTLRRAVATYKANFIDKNRAVGELGHPDGPTINLDKVSHKIVDLHEEGNNFIGRAELLDTPNGLIAKRLVDAGITLGVSSRGLGTIKSVSGLDTVQNDFYIATAADIVADPSAPDAFVSTIVENMEWEVDKSGKIVPKKEYNQKLNEQLALKSLKAFLSNL